MTYALPLSMAHKIMESVMKRLLIVLAVAYTSIGTAESAQPAFDLNSPKALAAQAKYDDYSREAQALLTIDLYQALARLDAAKKSRMAQGIKPEELALAMLNLTDDDIRAMSYATVLQQRGEAGDPYASYFYGVRQSDFCLYVQRQPGSGWAQAAEQCWQQILPAFKRASTANIAAASFNIGKLYEDGLGFSPSKLTAADWYVKSAEQYSRENSRDEALIAVRKALDLVPDHPAALLLRKAMLE